MAIGNCNTHNKPKTYQCYVCHKPLCDQCPRRDGCCSERCQQSRLKFGGRPTKAIRPSQGPVPYIMTALKIGAVLAVLYYGGKRLGVQEYLPESLGGPAASPSPSPTADDGDD